MPLPYQAQQDLSRSVILSVPNADPRGYHAMLLVRLPVRGCAEGFPGIVELIGLAKAANTAHRCPALFDSEKSTV